ncbi:MAG: ABC transporter ATP-binding protein, partial [Gramella sp.]|nr:ABC transporter ATP-binding protein [Christiangramia sp.]
VEKSEKVKTARKKDNNGEKRSFNDQKELKRIKNRLSKTEAKITKLEKELKEKDKELAGNYEKTVTKPDFLNNYNVSKKKLEKLMAEWEELQLDLEQIS